MTGESKTYKYTSLTSPLEKINYSYSIYEGEHFLNLWKENRRSIIIKCPEFSEIRLKNSDSDTELLFNQWIKKNDFANQEISQNLNTLIKRFEVTKKIYISYDTNFRSLDKSKFIDLRLYLLFSYILIQAFGTRNKAQYLNSLLKVNDILSGLFNSLNEENQALLGYCLSNEIEFIQQLKAKLS